MKTTPITNLLFFKTIAVWFVFISGYSQEYHIEDGNIKALKVFEVQTEEQAELNVFFVKNREQAKKQGLWYIGRHTPTSKPIRFVRIQEQADVRYYVVKNELQAGKRKRK